MSARAGLVLTADVRRAIVAHARREAPRECCGFLLGVGRRVTHAVPMTNAAPGTTRYRIDDREHINLRRALRAIQPPLSIVGVYHSHPASPSIPSETDVAEAHYPEWVHVIVSLADTRPRISGFRIANGRVRRVVIE